MLQFADEALRPCAPAPPVYRSTLPQCYHSFHGPLEDGLQQFEPPASGCAVRKSGVFVQKLLQSGYYGGREVVTLAHLRKVPRGL